MEKCDINAKQGDHITVLDSGTEGVKVRHNSTVGYMHCKYVLPDIKKGDKVVLVEDIQITIPKGTKIISKDSGYSGIKANVEAIIDCRKIEKSKS